MLVAVVVGVVVAVVVGELVGVDVGVVVRVDVCQTERGRASCQQPAGVFSLRLLTRRANKFGSNRPALANMAVWRWQSRQMIGAARVCVGSGLIQPGGG